MRIRNRFISAGFKLLYLIGATYGVLLSLFAPGAEISSALSFYVMQSNLLCVALTLVLLACDLADIDYHTCRVYTVLRFCVVTCILLEFFLYHAVLQPKLCAQYPDYFSRFSLSDTLLHTYTPLMMFLDYFLFDEKGQFRWWYAPLALVAPLLYAAYAAVYAASGGVFISFDKVQRVPYLFLDNRIMAPGETALWCVLIALGTLAGAFLFCALDHMLRRLWKAYRARPARARDTT